MTSLRGKLSVILSHFVGTVDKVGNLESETGEHEGLYLEIKHFKTDIDPVMAYKTLNGMGGRKWLKGVTLDIELRYTLIQ